MTTLAPVIVAVDDVTSFALFRWAGSVWAIYTRASGDLELHRAGDDIAAHTKLPPSYTRRAQVAAVPVGDELCIAWADIDAGTIVVSRWHLGVRSQTQAPTQLVVGSSPSIKVYKDDRLVMAYRDGSDRHVYSVSRDVGTTWSLPIVVDPAAVTDVDLDVYPESSNTAYWAETD